MKRPIEVALHDLETHLLAAARGELRSRLHIFVYPPEQEADMLRLLPERAVHCAQHGCAVEVVDLGQSLLAELERRPGAIDALCARELSSPATLLSDLAAISQRVVLSILRSSSDCSVRLIVNPGAMSTFVSFSAALSGIRWEPPDCEIAVPSVLAFPGEADDRALSLLGLRHDTNYRLPRI